MRRLCVNRRVLHIITTIELGGAEKQLLILCEEQIKEGKEIEIISLKGTPQLANDFFKIGVKISTQFSNLFIAFQAMKILSYCKKEKFELIHAHLPRAEVISALVSYFHSNRYFYTRHNAEKFWPKAPKFLSGILSRNVTARFIRGVAISSAVKDFLIENKEVKKAENLHLIHYGFDNKSFSLKSSNAKTLRVKKGNLVVGCIARLVHQKNLSTLIKAISILKQQDKVELLILGDGPKRFELNRLILDLSLEKNVTIIAKTRNVEEFLRNLDVFVLPSLYEGFGMVLLEAMYVKIPIVASNKPAIPEVMGEKYPFLFKSESYTDLASKIQLIREENIDKLTTYYSDRLKHFDSRVMCKKMTDFYDAK